MQQRDSRVYPFFFCLLRPLQRPLPLCLGRKSHDHNGDAHFFIFHFTSNTPKTFSCLLHNSNTHVVRRKLWNCSPWGLMDEVSVRLVQVLDPFHSTEFWKKLESLVLQQSFQLCVSRPVLSVYSTLAECMRLSFILPTELWIVWENYTSYNSRKVAAQSLAHDLSFVHIIRRWDPNKTCCLSHEHFQCLRCFISAHSYKTFKGDIGEMSSPTEIFTDNTHYVLRIFWITEYARSVIFFFFSKFESVFGIDRYVPLTIWWPCS